MYQSKDEIHRKLQQAKYALRKLGRFEGRIFVNEGRDEETGGFPLLNDFCSFATQTRSVFQYGLKEARERCMQRAYDAFVEHRPIIAFFADIRDADIHKYMPGVHLTIEGSSRIRSIDPKTGVGVGEPMSVYVESLDDLDSPKARNTDAHVKITVTKRLEPSPELIDRWNREGRMDLASYAQQDKLLYELLEYEGEDDIFKLCRSYLACAEEFYAHGVEAGFIT